MITAREQDNLQVVTYNINGLRGDRLKLLNIIKWSAEYHFQVIGISDTNIGKQQGKHINNNELDNMGYKGY